MIKGTRQKNCHDGQFCRLTISVTDSGWAWINGLESIHLYIALHCIQFLGNMLNFQMENRPEA
jgi:hypothetical protein